ncbi:NERD domain-containing protein [Lacrimispora sp. NSJ-141]|uniref:NERD domain-containing protein n=1 Tax=Lientehia hominis TaxID=2897778 RepID=A0AAP2WAC7_9FIRM|nr:NERD domain-containing protein [Lientehia hominis]MCD2492969.1 NERD domain-containing protein [Lientehia hominis]
MGIFDKYKEPVFLKESSNAAEEIDLLQSLLEKVPEDVQKQIQQDIRCLQAGNIGEDRIAFELKNSHMPMFILHDLYLVHGEYTAQIDYLIITRKRCFVLECKNLYGDIEVNSAGDFIRTMKYGNRYVKEGIYSPITQNQRHMEVIKAVRCESRGNIVTKTLFEKFFEQNYRSVVVLANPHTVLNSRYAKKEVKDKIIRADQLVTYIKKVNSERGAEDNGEKHMEEVARWFLGKHQDNPKNYFAKYESMINAEKLENKVEAVTREPAEVIPENTVAAKGTNSATAVICPRCGAHMVKRKATKGANAGNEFYGCSRYPKCRGIINIK